MEPLGEDGLDIYSGGDGALETCRRRLVLRLTGIVSMHFSGRGCSRDRSNLVSRAMLVPERTASQDCTTSLTVAGRTWRRSVAQCPRPWGCWMRAMSLPSQGRHMECETWQGGCDVDGRGKSVPPARLGTKACRPNDFAELTSPRVRSARGTDLWDAGRTQQPYLPTHQPGRRRFRITKRCTFSVHLVLCAGRFSR